MNKPAILALADGTVLHGLSIGSDGEAIGELVFNTAMSGYQEILTDPSYTRQIVTLTYPHIGNTGCNSEDTESKGVAAEGLVVRDYCQTASNWRSEQSLSEYLKSHNTVAISDIDTRHLTHLLRDKGAIAACISTDVADPQALVAKAQGFAGLNGVDLALEVSTKTSYEWNEGRGVWSSGKAEPTLHVLAYDFGVKHNILRILADKGCRLTVIPADTPFDALAAYQADGIFLSNGPGDPKACEYAITTIKQIIDAGMPVFGICLGFQLMALACGAHSEKMKFGHHGANHPVASVEGETQRVFITSQNHGFAIDEASLPESLAVTHRSLFDNSLQGIRHRDKPAFGFQGHPEASPGPHDLDELFDQFIQSMQK